MKKEFIHENNFEKARKKIREKKEKEIIFSSDNDDIVRKILEKEKINTILLKVSSRKDKMKQRDSGFNHVLARIAKKKNTIIGIDFDEILNSKDDEKAIIISRIRQNIKICKKNKLKMKFISKKEKDIYDLKATGIVLGMPTWMTKEL